jgi:hypothetical protein
MLQTELADQVSARKLKICFTSGIREVDTPRSELSPLFQEALITQAALDLAAPDVLQHYINNLTSGTSVPAIDGGLMRRSGGQEYYAPGELFFRS